MIGNVGRNSLRGPTFFQSDLAVMKDTRVTENVSVRFRVDVFNVFNKVNMGNPGTCVDCGTNSSAVPKITTLARGALQRQFQFSLKLQF